MSEKQRVLVVCHSAAGQMYLGVLLNRIWYSPILAKSAEEGVRIAERTPFSLVLYDADVPDSERRAAIVLLRNDPSVKDIPLAVFITPENLPVSTSLLSLGAATVITKPLDLSVVYAVLGRLTGQRRHAHRIQTKFVVGIREGVPAARLVCINLSEGGLYLRTPETLPEHTVIHLRFTLPRDSSVIELAARVVRAIPLGRQLETEPGIGLEFVDMPERVMLRIRSFVQWEMTNDLDWKVDI